MWRARCRPVWRHECRSYHHYAKRTSRRNALEFQAALFALSQACKHFPDQPFALFTDNLDTANRLKLAKEQGLARDAELAHGLNQMGMSDGLAQVSICWVKGHSSCRGNTLADQHAAVAAS